MRPSEIITKIRARLPERDASYIATEALYHLWGKENGFTPMMVDSQWFLEHRPSGLIVDMSSSLFATDYERAVPCTFMTEKPSKLTQRIIDEVDLEKAVNSSI